MDLDGSHVPSVTTVQNAFGWPQPQGGYPHHAVAALAQRAALRDTDHPPYPVPAWLYTAAYPDITSTTQTHMTGLSGSSCMSEAVPGHVPSPANHRHYRHRSHPRLERVTCDKCKKPMRRGSLKRHIKEVHDHIKRGHANV